MNMDLVIGKKIIKYNAYMVDFNNALHILGIINDDKLEELNKKRGMKIYETYETLNERYSK